MSYADAIAAGGALLEYVLRIDGYPYLFATRSGFSTTLGGATFEAVKVGLDRKGLNIGCRARALDVMPDTQDWTAVIRTDDADVLASLRSVDAAARTVLTATLSASATIMSVTSTTGFTSPVYVGGEPVSYTGGGSTTFSGLTRGLYGSRGYKHLVDTSIYPPCEPEVTQLPGPLDMRRASLYVAEYAGGALGTPQRIWTGYVSGPVRVRAGEVQLPLSSTASGLSSGVCMGWVTSGRLRGIYLPAASGATATSYRTMSFGAEGGSPAHETVSIAAGFYADANELVEAAIAAVAGAASGDWALEWGTAGLRLVYSGAGTLPYANGMLLWLLGFTASDDGGSGSERFVSILEAPDQPADVFAFTGEGLGRDAVTVRLYLHDGETENFLASGVTMASPSEPDTEYHPRLVAEVNTTDDYLRLSDGTIGGEGEAWPDIIIVRGGGAPPRISQVWHLSTRVDTIIKALVGATVSVGYTIPRAWRPLPYIDPTDSSDDEVGDVDYTELAAAVLSAPPELQRATLMLTEPVEARELIRDLLLPLGVYAYTKRSGKLGFKRLRVPSQGEEAAAITSAVLDAQALPDAAAELGEEPPVTVLQFEVPDGRAHLEATAGSTGLLCVDLRALQRYGTRIPRDTSDALGYLQSVATSVKCYALVDEDVSAWLRVAGQHLSSTLFAWSRAARAVVRLPVTPGARVHEIGDPVELTCWPVFDPYTGTIGLSAKLGIVVGWEESHETGSGVRDYLSVALVDEQYGIIAPAALMTSWDAGSKTGTFADAALYKRAGDTTDLDYFEVNDEIRTVQYDAESPSTGGPVGIVGITRTAVNGTVELDDDPFSGGGLPAGGAVMIFADWSEATADQQGEGWVWVSDDSTGLVAVGERAGWQWSP